MLGMRELCVGRAVRPPRWGRSSPSSRQLGGYRAVPSLPAEEPGTRTSALQRPPRRLDNGDRTGQVHVHRWVTLCPGLGSPAACVWLSRWCPLDTSLGVPRASWRQERGVQPRPPGQGDQAPGHREPVLVPTMPGARPSLSSPSDTLFPQERGPRCVTKAQHVGDVGPHPTPGGLGPLATRFARRRTSPRARGRRGQCPGLH